MNRSISHTLMRIAGAISCCKRFVTDASPALPSPALPSLLFDIVFIVVVVVVVVVGLIVVVVVVATLNLDMGPGLQMTPAASESSQSLIPQPSNRQFVKLFSLPTQ